MAQGSTLTVNSEALLSGQTWDLSFLSCYYIPALSGILYRNRISSYTLRFPIRVEREFFFGQFTSFWSIFSLSLTALFVECSTEVSSALAKLMNFNVSY